MNGVAVAGLLALALFLGAGLLLDVQLPQGGSVPIGQSVVRAHRCDGQHDEHGDCPSRGAVIAQGCGGAQCEEGVDLADAAGDGDTGKVLAPRPRALIAAPRPPG